MRPAPGDYVTINPQGDRNVRIVDGALVLKNIQKSMEGYYLCKASNGIGGISAVARIAVQGRLKIFFHNSHMQGFRFNTLPASIYHHSPKF